VGSSMTLLTKSEMSEMYRRAEYLIAGRSDIPKPRRSRVVDGVRLGERVDVVSPFIRPASGMNAVDQKNRRALAALGERDPSVAPVKAALFATNEVRQLVDALSCKSIVRGCRGKDGAAG